ncbi:MAG: hypothetical protein V4813_14910 [Gemmatimonadota bacterium]
MEVDVEPGAHIPRPVFVLARAAQAEMITVQALGQNPARVGGVRYWTIAVAGRGIVPDLAKVTYGETPTGYVAAAPALALFPGRYELNITAAGRIARSYFRVQDDGSVIDATAFY